MSYEMTNAIAPKPVQLSYHRLDESELTFHSRCFSPLSFTSINFFHPCDSPARHFLSTGCESLQNLDFRNSTQMELHVLNRHHLFIGSASLISFNLLQSVPPSSVGKHILLHKLQWYLCFPSLVPQKNLDM